jgi:2-oxoglutarate ferredoxin oxidoreductase subunit alpha
MSEFLGLAYFAEIPTVLVDVQRGGPSTGMPTRTQQSDLIAAAYASHGDTKQVLLFPSTPAECFEHMTTAFDLAEQLQTPVLVMTDLDLGMNDNMSPPLHWDDNKVYQRGKVLDAEALEKIERFGRYLDVDGDGITYRTIPGTHPTKGSFFTRGTSRDEYATYTEEGPAYVRNMDKLARKWETAKTYVPAPEFYQQEKQSNVGMIFFGTTTYAALEAKDLLEEQGIPLDVMRVKAFPFSDAVKTFIDEHERVFVVEQNRDAQFKSLLINELGTDSSDLYSILNYDGFPITADLIRQKIFKNLVGKLPPPFVPEKIGPPGAESSE